jgi:hypothetical protein
VVLPHAAWSSSAPNHVEEMGKEDLLISFAREFTHFFAIILWVGAALAFTAEHYGPGQGMSRDMMGTAFPTLLRRPGGRLRGQPRCQCLQPGGALARLAPERVQHPPLRHEERPPS